MNFNLSKGAHYHPDAGTCALEAVSILAGEPFRDDPVCVCPVISPFVRALNDRLPDDKTRNRLLLPLLPRLIGTRDSSKELARSYLAADYVVRVFAANALQAAGLPDTLSGLAEIVDEQTAKVAVEAAVEAAGAADDAFLNDDTNTAYTYAVTAYYITDSAATAAADAVDAAVFDVAYAATAAVSTALSAAAADAATYAKAVELIEKMIEI